MKKIFRLFAALAATTMAFSCMEEANPETGTQNGGSKFEGPMVTLTFSVDELTKTSYDKENGHQWSEGDQIKIDIPNYSISLLVSDEELAARKAKWQPREARITTGYLAKYASLVTSGAKGAIMEW